MILVISSKSAYATQRLVAEARIMNYELRVMEAVELAAVDFKIDITPYASLYIRDPYVKGSPEYLPQIVKLAKKFKAAGKKVVDNVITEGFLAMGKSSDYVLLAKAGLPIPKACKILGREKVPHCFPFIAKWTYGFKGENVFLIKNQKDLEKVLEKYTKNELIFQEFIEADYEYKVVTVGYKALPLTLRFDIKKEGFRLEHNNYKIVKSTTIPKVIKIAEKATKTLGRELSKVDILQKGNSLYILEANRYPGLESFEKLTKYNVTKDFLKYLV